MNALNNVYLISKIIGDWGGGWKTPPTPPSSGGFSIVPKPSGKVSTS